ncbi:FAD-dependent oxidoreductase [Kutzneria kofuensis]|uniref:Assimilatory nitrate reductase electron transfer subunit n=1 Tax=Kutzneria kofuensis TaxID=103725 RepID=A0A7W9KDF8_9PSEU|nr:FAD-dependent oxidoreductase [Kutzneria kofuensis]MBB5890580.1 assimilatory nitrate reductase electron transfer subunit [Kutzneria kofuensis]
MRITIIGYGMAGARLADNLRGSGASITVIGAEKHPAYNRILLSNVVAGSMTPDDVLLHSPEWARDNGIALRLGVAATSIHPADHSVVLSDGSTVDYDALVLATGSNPWIPPTDGLLEPDGRPAQGVVAFRNLEDCHQIVGMAKDFAPVAVLGGGLLGLEAARGLAGRGCPVTVVHPVGHLMERQLDPAGGHVLARVLRPKGIEFRLGQLATKYLPGKGLLLDDGSMVAADLVVVSAGARPETALAEAAGLAVDRGVVVDDRLRASAPDVYAIGDCATHPGTVGGLVQPAWDQAAVLARLLTGADARYRGTPVVTRLKTRDVDLASMGEVHVEPHTSDAEVVRLEDPSRGRYTKIVLRDDRVTGAIVLGAPDVAAAVTQLHDRGTPAPADRMALLLGRAMPSGGEVDPATLPASTLICRCNTVDKGRLVGAWRAGARSFDALVSTTMAGTGCGGCRDTVCALSRWLAEQDPVTEPEKLGCHTT